MKHKLIAIALVSILLFMLLGNSIGCGGGGGTTQYTLTTTSTAGGDVTTPGEGTYACNASQLVSLVATPESGYRFVNWTGDVATITNVTAASTTITMNGNYTITANFALGVFIANVPDTSWPPTSGLPNFCAPLAMVNILGYWDEVMGLPNAQNVTAWLQPSNLNTVADLVGFFMDTNNMAPPARGNGIDGHSGTYAKDILMLTGGKLDYVRWDAGNSFFTPPPVLPPGKLGHDWTGTDDYSTTTNIGFPFVKFELDNGRPLVVCYRWWNLIFGTNVTDPQSGKVISVYQWGSPSSNSTEPPEHWNGSYGEGCIGHAVTAVGYVLNWDPDGSGGPLPSGNWTIVHDTWATTPENVAVLWPGPWNSSHNVIP
jgi:uncharacterized repeat protein (TIGR02543 family)